MDILKTVETVYIYQFKWAIFSFLCQDGIYWRGFLNSQRYHFNNILLKHIRERCKRYHRSSSYHRNNLIWLNALVTWMLMSKTNFKYLSTFSKTLFLKYSRQAASDLNVPVFHMLPTNEALHVPDLWLPIFSPPISLRTADLLCKVSAAEWLRPLSFEGFCEAPVPCLYSHASTRWQRKGTEGGGRKNGRRNTNTPT